MEGSWWSPTNGSEPVESMKILGAHEEDLALLAKLMAIGTEDNERTNNPSGSLS